MVNETKKVVFWSIGLIIVGITINFLLSKMIDLLEIPLYLDNVGTLLVSCLSGPISGMVVGFATNVIKTTFAPISVFFSIVSICIGYYTGLMSRYNKLRSVKYWFISLLVYIILGGVIGSVMSYYLFEGEVGMVSSGPLTKIFLENTTLSKFWAQFFADLIIEIPDKSLTIIICIITIRLLPDKILNNFIHGEFYTKKYEKVNTDNKKVFKNSINNRIVKLMLISLSAISLSSTFVGGYTHIEYSIDRYTEQMENIANMSNEFLEDQDLDSFLQDQTTNEYQHIKRDLSNLAVDVKDLKYLYVLKVEDDGCYLLFDINNKYEDSIGKIIDISNEKNQYPEEWGNKQAFSGIIKDKKYGKLITSYVPIYNESENVVGYVVSQLLYNVVSIETKAFLVKMISIQLSLSLLIIAIIIRYTQIRFSEPLKTILNISREFAKSNPETWLESDTWKNRENMPRDDEFKELYSVVCASQKHVCNHLNEMKKMQEILVHSQNVEEENKELSSKIEVVTSESAAKTQYLSNMSHELRTPMNSIIGMTQLALDEVKENDEVYKYLKQIEDSGEYLLGIINDFLDISSIESGKFYLNKKWIDSNILLVPCIEMINSLIDKKNITFEYPSSILKQKNYQLYIDFQKVRQMIMNILNNAFKFTPPGGKITISIKNIEINREKSMAIDEVSISDTGCGMSEEFLEKIFTPFEQEQNIYTGVVKGTGLGLALSRKIAREMGGDITVESKLHEGSTFKILIPYQYRIANNTISQQEINDFSTLNGKKVFLVDDQDTNLLIAKKLLEKVGVVVEVAKDGQEAVDYYHQHQGEIDVILMDIRMPVMDGLEATTKIREFDKKIPIIAMTANAFSDDIKECIDRGMNDHISKPISPTKMYNAIIYSLSK